MSSGSSMVEVTAAVPSVSQETGQDAQADVMRFSDSVPTSMLGRDTKSLPFDSLGGGLDLSDYLSRWTLINTCTWASTNTFGAVVMSCDPWYMYLTNTAISKKLAGFKRLHADLDVRYIINASATQYGALVVGAYPQGTEGYGSNSAMPSGGTVSYNDTAPGISSMYGMDFVNELRPANSDSIEFSLPWVAPTDAIDLLNVTGDGAATGGPQTQWRIQAVVVAPLANSTNAASVAAVTIRCFARLRNVSLDVPVPQSTSAKTHKGVVGKTASAVTTAARAFKDVPFLSGVASGVEVVSSAVGTVADYFGFTRESTNPSGDVMVQRNYANITNADADDLDVPLGALRANKVSIDPAAGGSSAADQMAFTSLLQRRFFLGAITWASTGTAGTLLGTFPVHPWKCRLVSGSTYEAPPSALIAECFLYWRGDMVYELEIPASKQHRGRIQIVYYPSTVTATEDATNSSYNIIYDLDIDKTRKFRIGWAQIAPALRINVNQQSYNSANANGYFGIYVQTELTAPDPTASVQVLVFARCGSEMQFYRPCYPGQQTAYGIRCQADDVDDLVPLYSGDATSIAGGENVQSIRTLMQMPMISYFFSKFGDNSYYNGLNVFMATLGLDYIPYATNAQVRPESGFEDSLYLDNYLRHFYRMFLGWRGSRRWKFASFGVYNVNSGGGGDNEGGLVPAVTIYMANSTPASTEGTLVQTLYSNQYQGESCLVANDARNGTMVEARVPYWSSFRYSISRMKYIPNPGVLTTSWPMSVDVGVIQGSGGYPNGSTWPLGQMWESVADDFSFVNFRFVPQCTFSGTVS